MIKKIKNDQQSRQWRFFRAGGFDQVRLDRGDDLAELGSLDRKLWVALACPVDHINFDRKTLEYMDSDKNRRIRAEELIAAINWTLSLLNDRESIVKATGAITPADINETNDDGRKIATACRRALLSLGKQEHDYLSLEEIEKSKAALSSQPFNGDGVITDTSTTDVTLRNLINDIISTTGSNADRSGKPGIDKDIIDRFYSDIKAYSEWYRAKPSDFSSDNVSNDAVQIFGEINEKIDDFFTRCALCSFDNRLVAHLDTQPQSFEHFGNTLIFINDTICESLPVGRINNNATLSLTEGINPSWLERITRFKQNNVTPFFGSIETLTLNQWEQIKSKFNSLLAWLRKEPDTPIRKLGIEKITSLLAGKEYEQLTTLIEKDLAESATFSSLLDLEKLVHYKRDLHRLCCNFVNFKDFYSGAGIALFQAGTLYLDSRSCVLCLSVDDAAKHSGLAAMAGAFLVYCDLRRVGGTEKKTIVALFTDGDSENLIVGRNGIFYDRSGKDWDATIIKIIENPISIRQAFWLPYKNFVRMIEAQVAKRASTAEAQSTSLLESTAAKTATLDTSKAPPAKKVDVGTVAALGVAAGALGTFIATIMGYAAGLVKLGPFAIIGAIAGVLMLISGPSIVLAYIKLRKRNLGPILDACGWAINAKARINVPFGSALTKCATLPPGSQRDMFDPYAEKKSVWPKLLIVLACLWMGYFALDKTGLLVKFKRHFPSIKTELLTGKLTKFTK